MSRRPAPAPRLGGWSAFTERAFDPISDQEIELYMSRHGISRAKAIEAAEELRRDRVFRNGRYQVNRRDYDSPAAGWPPIIHLSIKRIDKERVGPERYRDFMRIKDELIGPEYWAYEAYPERANETDTANQYHLWVLDRPHAALPGIGWREPAQRDGSSAPGPGGYRQEPFSEVGEHGGETPRGQS